jgi:hypothetical protein
LLIQGENLGTVAAPTQLVPQWLGVRVFFGEAEAVRLRLLGKLERSIPSTTLRTRLRPYQEWRGWLS